VSPRNLFCPILDNGMGLVTAGFAMSFAIGLNGRRFKGARISFPNPDGAMNMATEMFLESDCERMFIADGDLIFTKRDVDFLLSHDVPLVFGCYPKRILQWTLCGSVLEGTNPFVPDPMAEGVNPLVAVDWMGKGFMSVHRDVFATLEPATPVYDSLDTGNPIHEFWKSLPGGHSEDKQFCRAYRASGGAVYADQRIILQEHQGQFSFPVDVSK
jgi:hypothetical protein